MSVHPTAELRDHAAGAYRLAADRARKVARYAQRLAEAAAETDGSPDRSREGDQLRHELGELVVLIDIAATYEAQADAVEGGASGPAADDVDRRHERAAAPAVEPRSPFSGLPHAGTYATERRARAVETARRVADDGLATGGEACHPAEASDVAPGEGRATQELAELDRRLEHLDRVAEDLLRSFETLRERFLAAGVARTSV